MPPPPSSPLAYEFGRFRLDGAERVLAHDGAEVPLTQKAFDVLLALVERGGHVVTKEELMRRVWPEQFVDESNLTQHVYTLRKILGEREGGRLYIETLPRRGYRFKPAVEVREGGAAPPVNAARAAAGAEVDERTAERPPRVDASAVDLFAQPKTFYARPGEVLVSHTVRDLVAGSGLAFEERGAETFDTAPGLWRLYKVSPT